MGDQQAVPPALHYPHRDVVIVEFGVVTRDTKSNCPAGYVLDGGVVLPFIYKCP